MKKLYVSSVLFLLSLLLFSGTAMGQGTPTYSTTIGTSNNIFPLQSTTNLCQYIYQPSLFSGTISGNITKVYIMANAATAGGTFNDLTIKIGNTSLSTFTSGTYITGLTTVYNSSSTTYPAIAAGDWFSVTLQTPFLYTGSSNFIVEISQTGYTGTGIQIRPDGSTNTRIYGTVGSTTGTAASGIPNFGFDMLPSAPCTSPPTAGTTVINATSVCSGTPLTLNLTGNSYGSAQSYQWQTSTSATGPWTNLGTASTVSPFYNTAATSTLYYRAAVTCGTSTAYSTPTLVTVAALFPGGTYTINSAVATGGTNFQTFTAAVSAIACGTTGAVVFNVSPSVYTEQVTIPEIFTNSAVNTITFNGSGATLTYAASASATPHTLALNGSDYFRFNNLNFVATGATYGLVAHLYNGANNNRFTACNFTAPLTSTSSYESPFSISGSATTATALGLGGNNNVVSDCNMVGGYYSATIVGNTGTLATGNRISNCNLTDFYYYGAYVSYTDSSIISNNNIERPTRTTFSYFYGVYLANTVTRALVEKNRIHDPFAMNTAYTGYAYGIYASYVYTTTMTAPTASRIENNLIYNFNTGSYQYGMMLYYTSFLKVRNNTIILDQTASTATGYTYGIYSYDYYVYGVGNEYQNNIIAITRGGTGYKYLYYLYSSSSLFSNNNILYMNSAGGTNNFTGYFYSAATGGATRVTLSDWQLANSGAFDANSFSTDPIFANPLTGNGKPTNLTLDNLGANNGILTDITGMTRILPTIDIGAYEFGSDCAVSAGLAASAITGTSATLSWSAAPLSQGYEYVLDRISTNPTTAGTATTALTYAPTTLRPLTTYYFHHRVKCATGGFSYWNTITFNTPCIIPSATIKLSGDSILCQNQPITLSADTTSQITYQWLRNGTPIPLANAKTYVTAAGGTYTVTQVMGTCNRTTNPVTLRVDTSLMAYVTYAGSSSICEGGIITFIANTGTGFNYQWLKNGATISNATNRTYAVEYSGTYRVKITKSGARCAALSDTIAVKVYENPYPQITRTGNLLSTTHPFVTYQWYKGVTPIAGATSATYTYANDATFYVKVTDTNGCSGQSSGYLVNYLGIGQVQSADIIIYPNPANDYVSVTAPVPVNISIHSMDGKTVLYKELATKVDIHSLSSGMYLLYVTDKDQKVLKIEKMVKQVN